MKPKLRAETRIARVRASTRGLAHDHAAETGGADSGFRVPAITSG
jgi:hypothetical protein